MWCIDGHTSQGPDLTFSSWVRFLLFCHIRVLSMLVSFIQEIQTGSRSIESVVEGSMGRHYFRRCTANCVQKYVVCFPGQSLSDAPFNKDCPSPLGGGCSGTPKQKLDVPFYKQKLSLFACWKQINSYKSYFIQGMLRK